MEKAFITLSTKSWHYKLIKAVLCDAAPTPKNMHNFCPYFWLLVFSLLTCWLVIPIRGFFWLLTKLVIALNNIADSLITEPSATKWENSLTDYDVWQIWKRDKKISKSYLKHNKEEYLLPTEFVSRWWEKKYGKNPSKDGGYHYLFPENTIFEFQEWEKAQAQEAINRRQKSLEELEYEERLENFRESVSDFFIGVKTQVNSWKNIIKWTKRVVGALVTGFLLFVSYFVINFMSKGILYMIDNWNWHLFFNLLIGIGIAIFIVVFFLLLSKFIDYLKELGTDIWYVKGLRWFCYWVLWMPFKVIFYYFFWQIILVNLAFFIWGGLKAIWKGLLGFFGIFGEYFNASYTDYCMEARWEETEKEAEFLQDFLEEEKEEKE
jgi:hypothetical protein